MSRIIFRILTILLISSSVIYSNESILPIASGSAKSYSNLNTNVSMDSEIVVIGLVDNYYNVDATFYFTNDGEEENIIVGFPKYAYGYFDFNGFRGLGYFYNFETYVNDMKVECQETDSTLTTDNSKIVKLTKDFTILDHFKNINDNSRWFLEMRWMVKKVIFLAKSKTITKVKYQIPYADFGFNEGVEYLYGTGKSWNGKIKKAKYIINASPTKWICTNIDYAHLFREHFTIDRVNEYTYSMTLENFEPDENATFSFVVSSSEQPWEGIEYYLKLKEISDNFLKILSLYQLRLLRNTIFALHGKIFNSPDLDGYFRKQYYYSPREDFDSNELNEIEKSNINKIFNYESKLKNDLKKYK